MERADGLRVWKGLFFLLWHSDGFETQEKLAERVANLFTRFTLAKNKWTFLQTAIEIMNREWMGIDRLRMSKFMLVLRLLFRKALEALADGKWESSQIHWMVGVMGVGPLQFHQPVGKQSAPLGLRFIK